MRASTNIYIDPPGGWRYGFPKPIPGFLINESHNDSDQAVYLLRMAADTRKRMSEWLEYQGYPIDDIEFALENSRFFELQQED